MSDFKNSFSTQHIDNKSTAIIIGLLIVTLVLTLVLQRVDFDSKELEDNIFDVNLTLTASLFGFVFIILAKNDLNKYAIGVMNSVLAVYFPIITILPYFLDPIYHLGWFIVIYIGGMLLWFFVVCPYIIGKENLDNVKDNNDKKFANYSAVIILRYLVYIFFGIIAMYILVLYFNELSSY